MSPSSSGLQQAFEHFTANPDHSYQWDDFEPLTPFEIPAFYSPDDIGRPAPEDAFTAIGMNGAHCVIAQWDAPNRSAQEWPIVWVDSGGGPTGVFASTFAEFLTILVYGIIFIKGILRAIQDEERTPTVAQYQQHLFTPAAAQLALEEHQKDYPASSLYLSWLHQIGLEKAANPADLIRQAYQRHPNLETWLGW